MAANTSKISSIYRGVKGAILGKHYDYTSGSINKGIIMLSIPMILEMIMESLFAIVDVFFVSRVGVDAVATVGLTESVITIIYSICIGLAMATTAVVARRVGEKRIEDAGNAAMQVMLLGGGLSLVIGVIGVVFAPEILGLMGASESVILEGTSYTRVLMGGNITIMLLWVINAVFRGAGDPSLAMRALWLANGLNIVLDPLFIFGWGPVPAMGVTGAAVATTLGRGIGVIYQLYILGSGASIIKLKVHKFRLRIKTLRNIIKISSGGMGQFLIESASWIFLIRIVAIFGSDVVAGYTIAVRVFIFTLLPSWGMANAAATLVGQNLGAGHPLRAERSVWITALYNAGFLGFLSFFMIIYAEGIVSLFTDQPEVVHGAVTALQIVSFGYVFFGLGMVVSQAFNGAGDTKTPTIINVFIFWLVQLPLAYFLSIYLDLQAAGVYWAIAFCHSLHALVSILIFRRGKWKKVEI